jgi:hypothetical protein
MTLKMSPIVTVDPDRKGSRPSTARRLTAAELKLARERADVISDTVKVTPMFREPGERISLTTSWAVVGLQRFDLQAVAAFSSDSIPAHPITREAMEVYCRHLRDGGVVAVQVSNRCLSLVPVVAAAAAEARLRAWFVEDLPADDTGLFESDRVLVAASDALLATLARQGHGRSAAWRG